MPDTIHFATVVLLVGGAGLVAVVSNRLTELVKVPLALLMLVGAAVAVNAVDSLQVPPGADRRAGGHRLPCSHHEVVLLADPDQYEQLAALFRAPV